MNPKNLQRHAFLLLALLLLCSSAASAADSPLVHVPTDAERARWTMADMRTLVIAIEAWSTDNGSYPPHEEIEAVVAAIEPIYVRKAPTRDAWGNPFLYKASTDGSSYRLISAGADGEFDASAWSVAGEAETFEEDAVVENGRPVRSWPYR